ncbi:hypothetical protein [Rhodobacter maris]|uniref:Dolichyl-phosphate-mannose-protein mannosyltransferase n=1 Tax=Rhodobacter maris TaxID=446682 RepID=A0A285RK58_9RHOB|nr:hypothetical protein [Rhodobacter maris]SOB94526.1 hypothetical protein SAMN05877831_101494 [Rhodobacter maris]
MAGRNDATNAKALGLGMAVLTLVFALAPLWPGAVVISQHEGDALHLADLVARMAEAGQWPHRDFMTPIGIGALWPIVVFAKLGLGFGHAFLAAQTFAAVLLFGPIWRAAASRFTGGLAWLFAGYGLTLCLALVHGETLPANSLAMHYNRWGWALAYVAVALALLEPRGARRPGLDGALIGTMLALMAVIKVTYFMAFAPAVVVALLARHDLRTLVVAFGTGLALALALTGLLGVTFWQGYLHDLMTVAASKERAAPGVSLGTLLTAPRYICATLLLLVTVIFLRQGGAKAAGLGLFGLAPAFVYVTYQNFGNDPQWLVLLGLLALMLRPESSVTNGFGWRLRDALAVTGAGALILAAGPALNLAWSPLRQALAHREGTVVYLSARPQDADLWAQARRVHGVTQTMAADGSGQPYAAFGAELPARAGQVTLNGMPLPECELVTGYGALFETAAKDLTAAGYAGARVLVADLFSGLWLFGPFPPIEGAAPWYYGGTPGLAAADHLLVPLCAVSKPSRAEFLKAVEAAGWTLEEELRTPTFVLLKPVAPPGH